MLIVTILVRTVVGDGVGRYCTVYGRYGIVTFCTVDGAAPAGESAGHIQRPAKVSRDKMR